MDFDANLSTSLENNVPDTSLNEPVNTDTSLSKEPDTNQTSENLSDYVIKNLDEKLIFGKYKTLDEAEKGYKELESYLGKQKTEFATQKLQEFEEKDKELEYFKELAAKNGYNNELEVKKHIYSQQMQNEFHSEQLRIIEKYARHFNIPAIDTKLRLYHDAMLKNDTHTTQNIINDLVARLDSNSILSLSREISDAQMRLNNKISILNNQINDEYTQELENTQKGFMESNSEFLTNHINNEIFEMYFNDAADDPNVIMNLIKKVRLDERKVFQEELKLNQKNDMEKARLRTVKDIDSSSNPIANKSLGINDILNLSSDEFARWAKS